MLADPFAGLCGGAITDRNVADCDDTFCAPLPPSIAAWPDGALQEGVPSILPSPEEDAPNVPAG